MIQVTISFVLKNGLGELPMFEVFTGNTEEEVKERIREYVAVSEKAGWTVTSMKERDCWHISNKV